MKCQTQEDNLNAMFSDIDPFIHTCNMTFEASPWLSR